MPLLHTIARRLRALVRRDTLDAEMNDELRLHFDMAVADGMRRGLSADQARASARRDFGGDTQVKEAYRDARGVRLLDDLVHDIRYGLRTLRRSPGFTAVVLLTLTLGIAANTAIFSVVHGVLLRALPYGDVNKLVMLWETDRDSGTDREAASVPDYFDFVSRARGFASIAGFTEPRAMNYLAADGTPERVSGTYVTGNFLPTLGVSAIVGRGFTRAEDTEGGARVAVVSERFWRSRLGGDRTALGRVLRLDDVSYVVVGVLPQRMEFPTSEVDLWIPFQLTPESGPRSNHYVSVIGRLRAGTTLGASQSEMTSIASQLEREYKASNNARGVRVESLEQTLLGPVRPALRILLGAVALVLLVACVNVANLMLARLTARGREVAVRSALGATRKRLTQQFVVESLLLTLAAAAIALALAPVTLRALVALAPSNLPRLDEVHLDATVLVVTLGVAVGVALAFGLLPALTSRGWGGASLGDHLRGGQRGGAMRYHQRLRGALVTAEVALAVMLLIGAGLLMQSFWHLRRVDLGWTPSHVLRVQFQLPASRYPQKYTDFPKSWARIIDFETELATRAAALPGARSAGIASNDPLDLGFTNSFVIEGREREAEHGQAELSTRAVSAGYFATIGIPVKQGRAFEVTDDASAPAVVIINEAAANKYFPNISPLGHRLRFWGTWRTIVGIVGNERFAGLAADFPAAMYPPITQAPMATGTLLVRADANAGALAAPVREIFRALDRQVAPYGVALMTDVIDDSVAQRRFTMQLLAGFAALALALALVGVYGVVSYDVAQRTQEIGVRMALGATRRDVVRHVLRGGSRLAIAGAAVGMIGALGATRLLSSQLYAVGAVDPLTFVVAALGTVLAALAGSWIPASRAAGVAPVTALRE
jgi:putative ABC transport system permease protein